MQKVRRAWRTITGLVTLSDIMGTVGFWLFRGTFRRTTGVAVALFTVFVIDKKTPDYDLGVTLKTAIGGTSLIFAVSCIGGLILMFLGGSFSKSALMLSEAKGSNLLEDMKKSRQPIHCRRLWQRVFRYEQAVHGVSPLDDEAAAVAAEHDELERLSHPSFADDLPADRRKHLERTMGRLGLTEGGWNLVFVYAMMLPLPRSVLRHSFRYDLSILKDWYDGAPFHHTDTKLQQQFDAVESIFEAKVESRVTRLFLLTHTRKRMFQKMWFRVISRAIQLRVARACRRLDKRYAPFHFSIDHFLWPNSAAEDVVRAQLGEGAVQDVVTLRQRIFSQVLTPEPELAQRLMQRAIYPNFEAACQLRRLYDPQYALGELDETWENDVVKYKRAFTPRERQLARRRSFIERTRQEQESLVDYLARRPELTLVEDPEALRALRVAVHVDRDGLKTLLLGNSHHNRTRGVRLADVIAGRRPVKPTKPIEAVIRDVTAQKGEYSRRLIAVRVHHELTRNELEDYEFYLEQIMGRSTQGAEVMKGNTAAHADGASVAMRDA